MIKKILFPIVFFTIYSLSAQQSFVAVTDTSDIPDEDYNFRSKPNIALLPFSDANAQAKEVEFGRTVSAMLATALRGNTNFSVLVSTMSLISMLVQLYLILPYTPGLRQN